MLTYERYTELGGTLPEAEFCVYESFSAYYLNTLAGGRLPAENVVESCMKLLIDAYEKSDKMLSSGNAVSFSNDGVSVSCQQYETPDSILAAAMERAALLFANAGVHKRSLAVRHRE